MALTRGEVMSRIRSKGTKLEVRFRGLAASRGVKLVRADHLYGKPDFRVLGRKQLVFVNSCFWHGCSEHCRMPASRSDYWLPKIERNVQRQKEVVSKLRQEGYSVFTFWEHDMGLPSFWRKLGRLK